MELAGGAGRGVGLVVGQVAGVEEGGDGPAVGGELAGQDAPLLVGADGSGPGLVLLELGGAGGGEPAVLPGDGGDDGLEGGLAAFPARWLPSVPIFEMLALFCIVRAVDTTTGQLYVSVGKPKYNLYLGVVNLAAMAATVVPLVLWRGAVGAAMCLLVARLVTMACNAFVLRRVLRCRLMLLVRVVTPALKASLVMALAVCGGLVVAYRQWGLIGWLPLGGLVVLGAVGYAAGLFFFERALFWEVLGLLRDALRSRAKPNVGL